MENELSKTEQPCTIHSVVGSALDIQYCKDCVNYPCNSYEKSAKCRLCSWNGIQQTKFERRSF